MRYTAVLLDLDGTLVDSEATTLKAWARAKREMGLTPDMAFLESLAGIHDDATDQRFAQRYPSLDVARTRAIMMETLLEEEARHLPVKPGVFELFDHLDQMDLPRALVTSTKAVRADRKLALTGLDTKFEVIVAVDHVTRAKPAPDPYLLGAAKLGHDPATCLVFEDSDTGVAAGHAAGCTVVQVPDIGAAGSDKAHFIAPTLLDGARACGLM